MTAEIILPRRSLPQPSPAIVPLGDCGACALGGMLGLSSPADVYDLLGGPPRSLQWIEQRQVLVNAMARGLADRLIDDTPIWPWIAPYHDLPWGLPGSWCQSKPWFDYLRMAFEAGYYGVTRVAFAAGGIGSLVNHVVLLCGAREPNGDGRVLQNEVLVSCSAHGGHATWVGAHEFLRDRGGFQVLLARPAGSR